MRLGDAAGYRETCRALVDVPVADADDWIKANTITALCLAPDALNDSSLLVSRAKEFVATNSLNQRHVELRLLGAALFRDGQYDQAAERLDESIATYPDDPLPAFDSINYTRLLLAMAKWQLGQKDEARRILAEAKPYVEKELYSPATRWNRRTTLQLLRDEAEAMIGSDQPDAAPTGENPQAIPND
jgi:tetratricopeptide (TPR) repeat protein